MSLNMGGKVQTAASERGGNTLKKEKIYLKAKALTVLHVPYSLDSGRAARRNPDQ